MIPKEFSINIENFNKKFAVNYVQVDREDPFHPISSKDIFTLNSNGKLVKFNFNNDQVI